MTRICLDGKWNAVYHHHCDVINNNIQYKTSAEITLASNMMSTTVPGNFEIDLVNNGVLSDLYYSDNILKVQDYEDTHWWYARTFDFEEYDEGAILCLEGVDTIADIYLNGEWVASTDNMLVAHEIDISGTVKLHNDLVVHIKPTCIEARKNSVNAGNQAHKYWYDGIRIRKAVHMFGWDIMPRAVSGGIWRSVYVYPKKKEQIKEFYIYPINKSGIKDYAALSFVFNVDVDEAELIKNYSIRVTGCCKDSTFTEEQKLWSTGGKYRIGVPNPYLWYPVGRGEQDMYDVTVELLKCGSVVDVFSTRLGIRNIELIRSSVTDQEGSGEFCFIINEEKVFVNGTNWVPLDAFHSQDVKRLNKALELLTDLNCNMVRCWGGNVYEDHAFFDYCDEHGIMVWQDFSMACAIYPQDDEFAAKIYDEAEKVIKKLRQHPSLTVWTGDNECDLVYADWEFRKDPNQNRLTREVLPRALADHDPTRPYLPSSPYIDEYAFSHGGSVNLPENHMWGARSYYKSGFYKNLMAHFASEQGYPGSPSTESLKKFLSPEKIWPYQTDEWIIHGASPESTPDVEYGNTTPFYFRTGVMAKEIDELFGDIPDEFVPFAVASQIVQAEAVKFFIETYRIGKWRRTGIMWWNVLDGWPQISDAVVDYYFCRKQAYYAIKMSQQPVCLMFGEMGDWGMSLHGVNDTKQSCEIRYRVKDLFDGGKVVMEGTANLSPDSSQGIDFLPFSVAKQAFLLIEWENDEISGRNYYLAGNPKFDINNTVSKFIESGLFQAEGFEENIADYFKTAE